jgi:putative ABC transport system ATP-binding protein
VAVADARPLVEALGVSRTYPGNVEVAAVRNASLELRSRDFTLLMGPSGSGKTSFLGMLAGFDPPDEGEIRWREAPFDRLTREELLTVRRTGMSVIFQSYGLLPSLTAVENVELPLRIGGTGLEEARARSTAWLERLELGHRLDHRTFELSGGQQQRVAVARALVVEPDVILADEPIAEVDSENADLILSALWEVVVRDGAVLAATHNPEALRYASRVLLFRDGVIEAEGSPDEVAAQLTTD